MNARSLTGNVVLRICSKRCGESQLFQLHLADFLLNQFDLLKIKDYAGNAGLSDTLWLFQLWRAVSLLPASEYQTCQWHYGCQCCSVGPLLWWRLKQLCFCLQASYHHHHLLHKQHIVTITPSSPSILILCPCGSENKLYRCTFGWLFYPTGQNTDMLLPQ